MRLAVLADIHGNLPALEAVLNDLRGRRVDTVVNLGDCVSGPLWPAETLRVLRQRGWPTVRGNHDRWVAQNAPDEMGPWDRFAAERLTAADRAWLGACPPRLDLSDGVLALHASPGDDDAYLIEAQDGRRLRRADPATVAARLGPEPARLVLTGHSHLPGEMRLGDGRLVVNPGSVGCPAYDDDSTTPPHVSETSSPSARYAIMDMTMPDTFLVEFIALPYPHEHAARRAEAAGWPGFAHALRTGCMPQVAS